MLLLVFLGCRWLSTTKFGLVQRAIRDGENRVLFSGYASAHFKLFIFVVAALIAGIGGALYVPQVGIINPSEMTPDKSLEAVVWVAVGGRGTVRKRREALKRIRAHRSMGSASLTLSYVACGRFDIYAQGAGLSAWDVAAAGLIAERAGARVTSLDGKPWFDLATPAKKWSCLAASPRHHATILELLG